MKICKKIVLIVMFVSISILFTYTFLVKSPLPFIWGIHEEVLDFDLNNFSKMFAMTLVAIVMFILIIVSALRKKVGFITLGLGGIVATIFVASFLSSSESIQNVTLLGYAYRYEGLLMWLCYLIFFIYILVSVRSINEINGIIKWTQVVLLVCGGIGLFQYFGFDLLKTTFFRAIMSPYNLWEYTIKTVPSHDSNVVYSTLANPNYVSFLFSITLPALTYWILVMEKVRFHHYVIWGIVFFCLMGANSSGGILGYAIAAFFAIVLIWKLIMVQKRRLYSLAFVAVICIIPNFISLLGDMVYVNPNPDNNALSNVTRTHNGILFENHSGVVLLKFDPSVNELKFESNNYSVDTFNNQGVITLEYPYNTFEFYSFDEQTFGYRVGNQYVRLTYQDGDYFVINPYGMLMSTWDVEASPLITNERFGTGRGYTWARSIPLLKETIFLGKGADSFVYYFPQDDILGKSTGLFEGPYAIIDKPHSSYIQIAFSFGLVFAILFFGVFIAYAVHAMKLTQLKEPTTIDNYIIAIGFSMIAFLVSALFYDLSVHVTPTIILMLGIGIVLLRLRKEEQQAKDVETVEMALELES